MSLSLIEQREGVRKIEDVELKTSLIDTVNSLIDTFDKDGYNLCVQAMPTPEAEFNHEVRELIEMMKKVVPKHSSFILYSKFSEIVTKRHVALEKLKEKKKQNQSKPKSYNLPDE